MDESDEDVEHATGGNQTDRVEERQSSQGYNPSQGFSRPHFPILGQGIMASIPTRCHLVQALVECGCASRGTANRIGGLNCGLGL